MLDWPLAYVLQDGQNTVPIPWDNIAAIFVGGSTEFKIGPEVRDCIKCAKILEKWVHIGRVNTEGRYEYFRDLGADSCDGTGIARYDHMRENLERGLNAPRLDFGNDSLPA